MKIKYGIRDNNIDITQVAFNVCFKNNVLIIPKGDHIRAAIFTDPLDGIQKSIFIETNASWIEEYDECQEIRIDAIDYFKTNIKIKYGTQSQNIDITETAFRLCLKHNVLFIPNDDHSRASMFTDPLEGVTKSIFVEHHNSVSEYNDSQQVIINVIEYFKQLFNNTNTQKIKIALGFWGITRSLSYTIDSIHEKILNVLTDANIEYHIFMHTYHLNEYKNERNNEIAITVNNDEYKLLNPDFIQIHDHMETKQQLNLTSYRSHKDPWNTNYQTMDNFILAMYSKSLLTNMIQDTNITYDSVIYLRPDVKYMDKLNIQHLQYVTDTNICIPNFHIFGDYAFNDRFCICNMNTYKLYGNVFDKLLPLSKSMSLHSETIYGKLMREEYQLNVINIPFMFVRVRCDGRCEDDDKQQ